MGETTEPTWPKGQNRIGLLRPPNCIVQDETNRYLDWVTQFGEVKLKMLDSSFNDVDVLIIPDYGVNWNRLPPFAQVKSSAYNNVSYDYYTIVSEKLLDIKEIPIIYLGFSGIDRLIMEGASFHFNKNIKKPKKFKVEYVENEKAENWTVMGIDYVRFREYPSPMWVPNCVAESNNSSLPSGKELPLIWINDKITIILYNPVYFENLPKSYLKQITSNNIGDYPSFTEMVVRMVETQKLREWTTPSK